MEIDILIKIWGSKWLSLHPRSLATIGLIREVNEIIIVCDDMIKDLLFLYSAICSRVHPRGSIDLEDTEVKYQRNNLYLCISFLDVNIRSNEMMNTDEKQISLLDNDMT